MTLADDRYSIFEMLASQTMGNRLSIIEYVKVLSMNCPNDSDKELLKILQRAEKEKWNE